MVQLSIQPINFFSGSVKKNGDHVVLKFQITLDCGCPTCAGGRFDPERFRVRLRLFKKDREICQLNCSYTGQASQFLCRLPSVRPGKYHLEIDGFDPETGAAGRLGMSLKVE